jgi:hypothetical protein
MEKNISAALHEDSSTISGHKNRHKSDFFEENGSKLLELSAAVSKVDTNAQQCQK